MDDSAGRVKAARCRFEEARDARRGTYPPRWPGFSEARARYWEWRDAVDEQEEQRMLVELVTRSGVPAGFVQLPPFRKAPEVVIWDGRAFVLDEADSSLRAAPPIYREVYALVAIGGPLPRCEA